MAPSTQTFEYLCSSSLVIHPSRLQLRAGDLGEIPRRALHLDVFVFLSAVFCSQGAVLDQIRHVDLRGRVFHGRAAAQDFRGELRAQRLPASLLRFDIRAARVAIQVESEDAVRSELLKQQGDVISHADQDGSHQDHCDDADDDAQYGKKRTELMLQDVGQGEAEVLAVEVYLFHVRSPSAWPRRAACGRQGMPDKSRRRCR